MLITFQVFRDTFQPLSQTLPISAPESAAKAPRLMALSGVNRKQIQQSTRHFTVFNSFHPSTEHQIRSKGRASRW